MSNKAIVETVGDHMYIDPTNGQLIEENRPTVVEMTSFVSQKIADGQIKLLTPNLPKEANDADFLATHGEFGEAENGKNASVASYAAEFGLDETGNTLPDGSAKKFKDAQKLKDQKKADDAAKANEANLKLEAQGIKPEGDKTAAGTNNLVKPDLHSTGTGKDNYQPAPAKTVTK